ncbi:MAG: hypothetical protein LBJ94_00465 [Puniceicoccales bacterium]|jgi:hypothetical protein|nr:hypothetical protein [Puniceicoccales bacterium]
MTSAAKSFILSEADLDRGVFRKIRVKAKEENVTIAQYLAGMLRHALKGHDLSKIHFYQDGSGQTYNVDVLEKIHEETMAEDARGELETFFSDEEALEHLRKIRKAVNDRRGLSNVQA